MKNKEFDQIEYINRYKKEKYKRYTAEVDKDLANDIDKLKSEMKLSNKDLLIKGYEKYKKEIKSKDI